MLYAESEEEVFAESYDDQEEKHNRLDNVQGSVDKDKTSFMGYPGCPNKWNIYHECTLFCQHTWGSGKAEPDPQYAEIHEKMMAKYGPLPDGWKEMYDPGSGRHFYWCTRTNRVSWLPPGHPKVKVTEAASHVRELIQHQLHPAEDEEEEEDDEEEDDDDEMDLDSDMESDGEEEERRKKSSKKFKGKEGKLDPMDPASYSDIPRGNWSAGLSDDGPRTGADATASGQLYQMRPYPSPGAVLRANQKKK